MTKAYGKGPKGRATALVSQIVRMRGYCQRCGTTENLQHAHIVRRSYNATRVDETNGWCVCGKCHYQIDNFHDEFTAMIEKTIGEDGYAALREKAVDGVGVKMDWPAEVVRLKLLLAQLEVT